MSIEFEAYLNSMLAGPHSVACDEIRKSVDNPIVRLVINAGVHGGLDSRQGLQLLAASLLQENRLLKSDLLKVYQNLPPRPVVIEGTNLVYFPPECDQPKEPQP